MPDFVNGSFEESSGNPAVAPSESVEGLVASSVCHGDCELTVGLLANATYDVLVFNDGYGTCAGSLTLMTAAPSAPGTPSQTHACT